MKKLALILGTMLLAIGSAANAAPTYCVSFIGFCDGMTFTQVSDGSAELTGTWENTDCAGGTATVKGTLAGGSVAKIGCGLASGTCPAGLGWTFKFTIATRTFDMYGDFDGQGGSPPFLNLNDFPFGLTTLDTGNCPFRSVDANAVPSWTMR